MKGCEKREPKREDARDERDGTRGESKEGVEGELEPFTRITKWPVYHTHTHPYM